MSVGPDYNVTWGPTEKIEVNERYWKAVINGEGFNFTSESGYSTNLINIVDELGDENDEFGIEILSPYCGENFTSGSMLSVRFNLTDPDDLITGDVDVGNYGNDSFNNSVLNDFTFEYGPLAPGNVPITVTANDSRGNQFKTIINVMVYNESDSNPQFYVAACIDEPKNFYKSKSSVIKFNASSTRAVKFNGSLYEINKSLLMINWTFLYYGNKVEYCNGFGDESCPNDNTGNVFNFKRRFPTVNQNRALLSVTVPASAMY